jgi:hypothetical protein
VSEHDRYRKMSDEEFLALMRERHGDRVAKLVANPPKTRRKTSHFAKLTVVRGNTEDPDAGPEAKNPRYPQARKHRVRPSTWAEALGAVR